jgi:hypothetical protein
MEKRLLGFVERLKKEGFSSRSVKMGRTAVRIFFDGPYLRLGMRRSDAPRGDPLGKKKSRRTVEQLIERLEPLLEKT